MESSETIQINLFKQLHVHHPEILPVRKQIHKSYHPTMSRHSHQIINHSKHHLFFRQKTKKTTTLRAQPVDSDKNFFLKWNPPRLSHLSEVSSISRGGLYQAQATPGRQSPVSSAANSWHQVKGTKPARLEGELHPPPSICGLSYWSCGH